MNTTRAANAPALEILGLSKRFDRALAVDAIDFAVREGEFVSLLGPSGCGKSTTLMMIAGFLAPTAGEIRIAGQRVNEQPPEHRKTGMVFQSYALFPHMTVQENVGFGLRMRGIDAAARRRKVDQLLELVNMGELRDRLPRQLSGGQQQRVALARALVIEPALLLLDEPFSALDRKLREQMQTEVRTLQRRLGITTVFVTHDQEEALVMSDRVAVMNGGRIEGLSDPRTLYRTPPTAFVARFLGAGNFIPGTVSGARDGQITADTAMGQIRARGQNFAVGDAVELFIRPEQVRVAVADATAPDHTCIPGRLVETYFHGARTLAVVETAGLTAPVIVDGRAIEAFILDAPGSTVQLVVQHSQWCVYRRAETAARHEPEGRAPSVTRAHRGSPDGAVP